MLRRLLAAGGAGGSFTPPPVSYALFNGWAGSGGNAIGAASNTAGAGWVETAGNPIFTKTGAGWEAYAVSAPYLIWDGSQFVIFYGGFDGTEIPSIGRATAPTWASILAGTITRYGSNPVLTHGGAGAFDEQSVQYPIVYHDVTAPNGHAWWMWYSGTNGAGSQYTMGCAYSDDGLTWTKIGQVLNVGSAGQWDADDVGPGAIYYSAPNWTMLYSGRHGAHTQGGVVTFTDPAGTYTRGGSNPTLKARYNDAGTSQLLTADTGAGSAAVEVADSSVYNVGEPCILESTTTQAEIHTILAIPDSTHTTLKEPTVAAFTVADTAGFRPFAWNSVGFHGPVRAIAGGYEAYFGPFEPLDDLSAAFGNHIWEGSMRATSSSLTGAWNYDYTTGLLFPLSPQTSGWHKFSAENQCVISAP